MWLFTKIGFFSVVQHRNRPGDVLVRARFRDDIDRLLAYMGAEDVPVDDVSGTDYAYRVVIPHALWSDTVWRPADGWPEDKALQAALSKENVNAALQHYTSERKDLAQRTNPHDALTVVL